MDKMFHNNVTSLFHASVLVVLVCLLSGCGNKYGTTAVSGSVTLDGKPLKGATVIFYPTEGGRANSTSKTNDDGEYKLNYTHDSEGAVPGSYKVLISKIKIVNDHEVETLPLRYNSDSSTVVEVVKRGKNQFKFELTSEKD